MTRPVSLARILCLLALLAAAGCRSAGPGGGAPEPGAQGGEHNGRPGADATPAGNGWAWTAPPPAWIGMPAADDREIAFTYGHQHLVLLDADGRLMWDVYRLGLRDVAPLLTAEAVVAATDHGMAAFRRSDGANIWEATEAERVNTPVVAGRLVVASTWEGTVIAFDLVDGKAAWRAALPGPSLGPPATDGTTVVVTWDRADRRTGGAVAIDAATGRQRWAAPLPGGGISAPTVTPNGSAVAVAGDLAAHALALG
nr:PQQ-binding-like beta-propeller repeat protein [Actinomycetota bacterium]